MVEGHLARATVRTAGGNGTSSRHSTFKLFEPLHDPRATFEMILAQAPNVRNGNGGEASLRKAFDTASQIFDGQKRKGGDRDVIFHPLGVAFYVLVILNGSYISGARALMHDVIEDGPKRRLAVNYASLRLEFGEQISRGVALLTTPRCVRPRPNPTEGETTHIWIPATHSVFNFAPDFYRSKDESYPPEVYREMRRVYFDGLLSADGISTFPIKLADAIDNLSDIEHLSPASRARKLAEDIELIKIAARIDWDLYELMAHFLAMHGMTVPDLRDEIAAQQEKKVVVCRPRDQLDFKMVSEEIPIQHPTNAVITVYIDLARVYAHDLLEIGLPRIGNGHNLERLRALCADLNLEFRSGRSLFRGYFDLDAKDSIYAVTGLSGDTRRQTRRRIDKFLDRLRKLQEELAAKRRAQIIDPAAESLRADFIDSRPTGTDGE
ncbi:hypothetical protein J4450_03545 [Candidatus Micrarchaeota archaeon]|nr:hypothetical protein [Candidatus Micrarchaeota archaeon]